MIYGFGQHLDLAEKRSELLVVFGKQPVDQIRIALDQLGQLFNHLADLGQDFNFYAGVVFLVLSLCLFFLFRQIDQVWPKKLKGQLWSRVSQVIYFGPSQIVPFFATCLFLSGQAVPALIANSISGRLQASGALTDNSSQFIVLALAGLFNLFSLYLLTGTVLSLAIVSRAGASPSDAWLLAWRVSRQRRQLVFGYLFAFLVLVFLATTLLFLPILIFLSSVAEYLFYIWLVCLFFFGHGYFYNFYRLLIGQKPKSRRVKIVRLGLKNFKDEN